MEVREGLQLTCAEHLICKHWLKCFHEHDLVQSSQLPYFIDVPTCPFHRGGSWYSEQWSSLPQDSCVGSGSIRIQSQNFPTPMPILPFTVTPCLLTYSISWVTQESTFPFSDIYCNYIRNFLITREETQGKGKCSPTLHVWCLFKLKSLYLQIITIPSITCAWLA